MAKGKIYASIRPGSAATNHRGPGAWRRRRRSVQALWRQPQKRRTFLERASPDRPMPAQKDWWLSPFPIGSARWPDRTLDTSPARFVSGRTTATLSGPVGDFHWYHGIMASPASFGVEF